MRSYADQLVERGRRRGLKQGLDLKGHAEAVLRILAARGVPVGEAASERILTCTDKVLLDRWLERALNAITLSDVLDDAAPSANRA